MRLLDEQVPVYEVWERHSVALPVAPERALQLALAAPATPASVVRTLMQLRGLGVPSGSLERRRWLKAKAIARAA